MHDRRRSEAAKVHVTTLVRLEAAGWRIAPGKAETIDRIVRALESEGVRFTELGVELVRKPRR